MRPERWGVVLLAALLAGGFLYYSLRSERSSRARRNADERAAGDELASFASAHNAVVKWTAALPPRGRFSAPLVTDLVAALVRPNQKPVLLQMQFSQVTEREGSFSAHFSAYYLTNGLFSLQADFSCTAEQAARLRQSTTTAGARFAVIARITDVSRGLQQPGEGAGGSEGRASAATSPELEGASDVFVARGTCVDLLELPRAVSQ
ncbi:MAG: hypothetical protein HYY24_16985 [Verrucomicrobia bacterium]|nr:hypothetical protein [Verrucomicrobiota bacterium]